MEFRVAVRRPPSPRPRAANFLKKNILLFERAKAEVDPDLNFWNGRGENHLHFFLSTIKKHNCQCSMSNRETFFRKLFLYVAQVDK